ncbi:MAG: NADH-quinone oxidoreductase subunit A [Phycisphaerales bacterium]|nr:NADH-quinone oxidoreductase subunit A [Phycisphaerales bacterium]
MLLPRCKDSHRSAAREPDRAKVPANIYTAPMLASAELVNYLPVALIFVMAIIFGAVNLIGTSILGPSRTGGEKSDTYESGMNPIGTARRRFNIRFYILAMTFLVFDIEIIFLYPWALDFAQLSPGSPEATLFLGRILFFIAMSVIAYIYAWKKGVFRWD